MAGLLAQPEYSTFRVGRYGGNQRTYNVPSRNGGIQHVVNEAIQHADALLAELAKGDDHG
jgi:hypothetical protein